ncbi:MAG: DNA cytosine methyltransferase [Cyanobacteriota bacterium]|nr:DNA cytosine methyltransferase [Cyanobacteriota bacterium]
MAIAFPKPSNLWKVVDLFSGCGGMSAGFSAHKDFFLIVGAVDREVAKPGRGKNKANSTRCNATYHRNIGIQPKNADLTTLNPRVYREELGLEKEELDVLIACPPCTGFSQKNSKNHLKDDPRNRLVERTAAFIEEFMPEFFVMENVKELLRGKNQHHFHKLCHRLETLNYSMNASIHELSNYGLPQRRERALAIARRDRGFLGDYPLKPVAKKRTVWDTIARLPVVNAGEVHPSDSMHVSPGMTSTVRSRIQAIPKDGGSWGDIMNNPHLSYEEKHRLLIPSMFRARPGSFPDVYGRLKWHSIAATITRECSHVGNGRYVHPEQDRLLTVREMSLLQGFPANYFFEGPISAKYNQIGDAVPPSISTQIAQYIIQLKLDRDKIKTHPHLSSTYEVTHQLNLLEGITVR